MNAKIATELAEKFLAGAFETVDALLGSKFSQIPARPENGTPESLQAWCDDYPVWFHAKIEGGGSVAILWKQESIASLVARVGGEDPKSKTSVTADDSAMLQELCDALVGGGASALGSMLNTVVTLDSSGYRLNEGPATLTEAMGKGLVGIGVAFSDSGQDPGEAMFVYSGDLEARVSALSKGAGDLLVSEEEVRDILQGFTPEDETDHGNGGGRRNGGPMPDNLDVVLDIELLATVRLGKVEVPIAEVLNYGPGSIIELGHVVDEPVELLVNGKLIARGDVVVVDERFGLRITEIVSPRERIESLR